MSTHTLIEPSIATSERQAPAGKPALIRVRGLCKTYHTNAGEVAALRDVDLDFRQGEMAAVIGKSGAGKSTLVNMLAGIDRVSAGGVVIDGQPVHNMSETALATWRCRHLGVVHQSFELLPQLSLLDNVMLPMDLAGTYQGRKSRALALELLTLVGLEAHAFKSPSATSGGQQQRVAIARALANDPPILIGDEPTGNLDSATADIIWALFDDLAAQGKTIIVVTHDMGLAERVTHRVSLADGRVVDEYWQPSAKKDTTWH